jgi:hypothetical protein
MHQMSATCKLRTNSYRSRWHALLPHLQPQHLTFYGRRLWQDYQTRQVWPVQRGDEYDHRKGGYRVGVLEHYFVWLVHMRQQNHYRGSYRDLEREYCTYFAVRSESDMGMKPMECLEFDVIQRRSAVFQRCQNC